MKLTERDLEIIHFINDFGFCETPHINKRFDLKKPRNYQVMNRLMEADLVKHERVFYAKPGIFRLTEKGAKLTDMPPLFRVPLGSYDHDTMLIDVYLKLKKKYPEAKWISERKLRHEKFFDGVGQHGHLSDGILVFPDGKQVAIELELSLKGKRRLEKILKGYSAQFDINEVWYYCAPNVLNLIRSMASNISFVKIFPLNELLV